MIQRPAKNAVIGELGEDASLIILERKGKRNMPKPLSERKWGITKHAFYQAYHFALRYNEFKDILKYKTDTVGSQEMEGMPRGNENSDATQSLAIVRQQMAENCELIEQTALEADADIYQYILKAVTEGATFKYLKTVMDMPCEKDMFYDRRRKFYYLLSKKM